MKLSNYTSTLALSLAFLVGGAGAHAAETPLRVSQVLSALSPEQETLLRAEFFGRGLSDADLARLEITQGEAPEPASPSPRSLSIGKAARVQRSSLESSESLGASASDAQRVRSFLSLRDTGDSGQKIADDDLIYVGLRLGFIMLAGVNLTYVDRDEHGRFKTHVDLEVSHSIFLANLSAAVGFHRKSSKPNSSNSFYIGGRVHRVWVFPWFNYASDEWRWGVGPEIGWLMPFGNKDRGLFSVRVGAMALEDKPTGVLILPDIKLGIALKIGSLR